jgi:ribosomal protein S12 methylthiotransferase accessory factor
MELASTYLNGRIEFFDAVYGPERHAQYTSLPKLYNRTIGPVRGISLHRPSMLDLSMYGTSCDHTLTGYIVRDLLGRGPSSEMSAIPIGGKGASMQQALLGNLGEASERLLAMLHSSVAMDRVEFSTYADLVHQGRRALGPAEVPLFLPEQYKCPGFNFVPFEPGTPIWWTEGRELLTGEPVMAPAQLTLFGWKGRRGEARIGYATSGGLVFHPDRRHAILHGIYENIERDAINLRWYCHMSPPRVEVEIDAFLAEHAGLSHPRMSTPYIQPVQVFLNTVDFPIPVFTAITVDRSRRDRAMLPGGGAWSRKERALIQAIFEIGQAQTGYNLSPHAFDHIRPDSEIFELTDFYYAPVYYGYVQNLPKMAWYTEGRQVVPWDQVPTTTAKNLDEEYEIMTGWLRANDINPLLFDFGSACWPGVFVTKIYMPQLTYAHVPAYPYLGHPRYYEVPQRMGMADHRLELKDLVPDPLPFP